MKRAYLTLAAAALASCSVPPIGDKGCPCLDGYTCKIEPNQCVVVAERPTARLGCAVYSDGRLYCGNVSPSAMYAAPRSSSERVNTLATVYSWFDCWGTGELHSGGNTTWYHTQGDDSAAFGWVAAGDVYTPNVTSFDADPSQFGFDRCSEP
jgi:hypothetical protein